MPPLPAPHPPVQARPPIAEWLTETPAGPRVCATDRCSPATAGWLGECMLYDPWCKACIRLVGCLQAHLFVYKVKVGLQKQNAIQTPPVRGRGADYHMNAYNLGIEGIALYLYGTVN